MFETIEKAKQLGVIALERIGDYLELLRISAEIQGQNLKKRIISFVMVVLFAVLSLIFLGLAIIVTCWDTPLSGDRCMGGRGFLCLDSFCGLYVKSKPARSCFSFGYAAR